MPESGCPHKIANGTRCGLIGTDFQTQFVKRKDGRDGYGTWDERPVDIGFDPFPKRERETIELGGPYARLHIRDLGGLESARYPVGQGRTSPEGEAARLSAEEAQEQEDWDDGFAFLR